MRYPEPRLAVISYPRRLVRSFSRQASPRVQVALSQMSLSVIEFPLSRPSTADQVAIFLDSFHRRLSHSHAFHRSVSFTLPQVYFARWPSFPHVAAASAATVRFRSLVFVDATPLLSASVGSFRCLTSKHHGPRRYPLPFDPAYHRRLSHRSRSVCLRSILFV